MYNHIGMKKVTLKTKIYKYINIKNGKNKENEKTKLKGCMSKLMGNNNKIKLIKTLEKYMKK